MKILRLARAFFALSVVAGAALAADALGTWKWQINTPNGDVETTLKLAMKDGKLDGVYQNQLGQTSIKDATFKEDILAFSVDREFGGNKFTLKLRGKVDGDTIKGEIEVPAFDGGGQATKMEWNAKRVPEAAGATKK